MNHRKESLLTQLKDLQGKKPKGQTDEVLLLDIQRLDSSRLIAQDDLVGVRTYASVSILSSLQNAARLRRTGIREELQHVSNQLNTLTPQIDAATASHNQLREQVETLQAVIGEADDSVFSDFCRRIGVDSIRDYEERQLKVAQAVNEARHRFDTQIARLTTQYVFHLTIRFIPSSVVG